jgi:hypothetical protein
MTSEPNKPDTAEVQESNRPCEFYCLDDNGEVNCLNFYDEKGVVRQVPKGVCDHHDCPEYVITTIEEFKKTWDSDKCKFTPSRLCTVKGMNCDDCPRVKFSEPITTIEEFKKTWDSDKCRLTESGLCTVKGVKCRDCPHYFSSQRRAHKK